jgi:hypothetical protein
MMINGVGRLGVAALCVLVLGAAPRADGRVLLGLVAAATLSAWRTRSIWLGSPKAFDWRGCSRKSS